MTPKVFVERLIADGTRTASEAVVQEALAHEISTGIELTGHLKNGSHIPLEIMRSPPASAKGILVTGEEFESPVKNINDFWLTKVKLPRQGPGM